MSTSDVTPEISAILAQFPGPVPIYPSRDKIVGFLVLALAMFIAGAFGFFGTRRSSLFFDTFFHLLLGVLCLSYFGWWIVGFIRLLASGAPLLTLRCDGLAADTVLRRWDLKWSEVQEIHAGYPGSLKRVYVNYQLATGKRRLFAPCLMLPGIQPMSVQELAHLMNLWRQRALASAPTSELVEGRR